MRGFLAGDGVARSNVASAPLVVCDLVSSCCWFVGLSLLRKARSTGLAGCGGVGESSRASANALHVGGVWLEGCVRFFWVSCCKSLAFSSSNSLIRLMAMLSVLGGWLVELCVASAAGGVVFCVLPVPVVGDISCNHSAMWVARCLTASFRCTDCPSSAAKVTAMRSMEIRLLRMMDNRSVAKAACSMEWVNTG